MQNELLPQAEQYIKRKSRLKLRQKIVVTLACLVVFCTTYALILPAITMEQTAYCGMEEHHHGPECYERRLICGYDEDTEVLENSEALAADHIHTDECYEERQVLICGLEEGTGHVHDESCVQTEQSHAHIDGHKHTDKCYEERQELVCGQAEGPGHIHDESCIRMEPTLICTEDHEHTDECYKDVETYICGMTEGEGAHTHGAKCYETQRILTCNLPETEEAPATSSYSCGLTEGEGAHTHGPECYETQRVLTCGHTETGEALEAPSGTHIHTDECYEEVLVCDKPEHEHSLSCFSNPKADIESRNVWERTVAGVELTGVWADDLVAIAHSQLGYEESKANYVVMDDGKTIKGYTRYGAWYGSSYADWCAMFVSFCLNYAEIPKTAVPYQAGCSTWVDILSASEWNLYRDADEYTPAKGDIVFFDFNGDDKSDHVGIVAEYIVETDQIKTIEGNSADRVQYVTRSIDDIKICGYGALPEKGQENQNIVLLETTKTALIYTDGTYETVLEDEAVITLTGLMPEDVEVKAFPVTVETQMQVLCAYDISIVMPDGTLYEPAEGEKISVTIQTPELNDDETAINTAAYYIPEDSAPVPMDTAFDEDGTVSFDTDHFSVYALMSSVPKRTEVYLNGATGNDTNDGSQASPVKTLEKALSLVAENGTIYVSGTVTVSSEESWSIGIAGVKIQRASGFTGPLVTVANGGSLTLSHLTMNGGNGEILNQLLTNGNTRYSTAYATNSARAPLIVVNTGGSLNIANGTVLEHNSNKPSDNPFIKNGYVGLGGAVYSNGTMMMTGGLIQDCEAQSGGGIYVENGTFNLSGGTIDHNFARNIQSYSGSQGVYRTNAGGGVYVGDNSSMIMSGGVVSNNESSREGGGISLGWLNRDPGNEIPNYTTTFTMTGGIFTRNKALSTGGGLNVTAGRIATVSAGYFTSNSAYSYDSQGNAVGGYRVFCGGGIYVDAAQWNSNGEYAGEPGKLILHRAIITNNTSNKQGGGIAACPTGISHINANLDLGNGTAIYNNNADTTLVGINKEIGIRDKNNSDLISEKVLGGGDYNWTSGISTFSGTPPRVWTDYGNTLTDDSPEIIAAKSLATVWITDNYGDLGGGIGNNGIIQVGGETEDTFVSITITKEWIAECAVRPDFITVQILQDDIPYGDPIRIYKTLDENNQEIWPTYYVDGLPGHPVGSPDQPYEYTIAEVSVPGFSNEVSKDGNNFTVTNTKTGFWVTKKWIGDTPIDRPTSIDVQLLQNGEEYGSAVQLTVANNWTYIWENLPKENENQELYTYSVQEINIPDGYFNTGSGYVPESGMWEITNTKIEKTSVSVEKRWANGTPPAMDVTVQLKADGEPYGEPVTISATNNWFYRWNNLPKYTAENVALGIPIDYTVGEVNANGYWPSIKKAVQSDASSGWTVVDALEDGKTYLLVTNNRALAGTTSTNQLQWINVFNELITGNTPSQAALWTYYSTGSRLRNGDDKYLILSINTPYVFFTDPEFNRAVYFTNGLLSAKGAYNNYLYDWYFTGTFTENGYGNTSTYISNAITFTLYTQTSDTSNWGDTHYIVTNETASESIDVSFGKYLAGRDQDNPVLIEGAALALYRQDENGTIIPGTNVTGIPIEEWTSDGVEVNLKNLTKGTYYLVETEAPEGYMGLAGPIIFTVNPANAQVIIEQYPGYSSLEGTNLFTEGSALVPVYNSVAYSLPETGGPGTIAYTIGGILLTITASFLLYINFTRRKRLSHPSDV